MTAVGTVQEVREWRGRGNLRELGARRELARADAKDFARWFMRREPVILTGLRVDLAAWTPESVVARSGSTRVRICTHEAATASDPMGYTDEVTIAEYFARHFEAAAARRIMGFPLAGLDATKDDMGRRIGLDAVLPPMLAASRSLFYASAAGGRVPLHFDIDFAHIFMIQAYGSRNVHLFAHGQSRNLYKVPFRPEPAVPLEDVDTARFPRLSGLKGYCGRLAAGEVLYMPSRYWHLVEYAEPACGISLRYRRAGLPGRVLAWYGKKVAAFDHGMRTGGLGRTYIDVVGGLARL